MIDPWLAVNNLFLFACTSMYLGTGWSLVLFSLPSASQLTPGNYYQQLVPQVTAATKFFTVMTALMLAACVAMIVGEPTPNYWILPAVVLAGVIAATVLTLLIILPDNKKMEAHITSPTDLHQVLHHWIVCNWIRVGLWTVQWSAMAIWFGLMVTR